MIKPDGFPDFYQTFESKCKNKGADGTARALRVVPVFNKVGVLAALNIYRRLVKKQISIISRSILFSNTEPKTMLYKFLPCVYEQLKAST